MPKLRGYVVDDTLLMRRIVRQVLERDPEIEVVGTASGGRHALLAIDQAVPDFVTVDIEMPEMDGIATLRELRRRYPRLPVIMISLATKRGARSTLDALAAGANDYVTWPADAADLSEVIDRLAAELLPKVRTHCVRSAGAPAPSGTARSGGATKGLPVSRSAQPSDFDLVCIAISTGGPNALVDVFSGLTVPLPVPVAVVQHMPRAFTRQLAERLDKCSPGMCAVEATEGDVLEPGTAYVAPGGRHLSIARNGMRRLVARLLDTPPENSCRPAGDVLFRTAAQVVPGRVLAVVMTGMGHDGRRGAEAIRAGGGCIIAQDEATSVVWGMPGSVVEAGLADAVVPLGEIAGEIMRRTGGEAPPVG